MVGIGAGGHAKVVAEIIQLCGLHEIVGLVDANPTLHGAEIGGLPILGGEEVLARLRSEGVTSAFIGVGSVGDASRRKELFESLAALGFETVEAIHPKAVVSRSARLGAGAIIMAGAVVNPGATIGDNVIVNTGAIIDHDCTIGAHCHVAPGATLSGTVTLGEGVHIGVGATIRQGIAVGDRAIVGAGAVVVKDVAPGATVVGVPAQPLSRRPT